MTPKSEPWDEEDLALADAIACLTKFTHIHRSPCAERSVASLQSLRERLERERAFVEAAKAASMYMDGIFTHPDDRLGAQQGDLLMFKMLDAYRALAAPPEGKP